MSKLLTIFIFLVVMFLVNCRQSHGHTKIPKKDNANIRGHKSKRVVTKSTLHLPGVPGSMKKAKSPLTSIWELLRTFKGDEGKYWRLAGGFTKKSPMRRRKVLEIGRWFYQEV